MPWLSGERNAIYGGTGGACIDRALNFVAHGVGMTREGRDRLIRLERFYHEVAAEVQFGKRELKHWLGG
ncbi:MAG: hypothetical protein WBD20_15515, partial [Pirellulaceae bacterium]